MRYENVIVIGYGVIAGHVIETVYQYQSKYDFKLIYLEHEVHPFNSAARFAQNHCISDERIEDKKALHDYFSKLESPTLIISSNNNYLFPSDVVKRDNISIINFHNALLPNYPGRNAPTWAIYNGEKETGITWHYVNEGIDEGDIIVQKTCPISDNAKAYELTSKLMEIGGEAFDECIESVLNDNVVTRKQCYTPGRRLYRSKEIPGDGKIDFNAPVKDIYKLLRALDYGKYEIFPLPYADWKGERIQICRYKVVPKTEIIHEGKENVILLGMDDSHELCLTFKVVDIIVKNI